MGIKDAATAPLRFAVNTAQEVLQTAQNEAGKANPVRDIAEIESHVLHVVEAIKESTEQIAAQVDSLDRLVVSITPLISDTLPALTLAVQQLTTELAAVKPLTEAVNSIQEVLAPLAHAEAEVGKVGHLFSRRRDNG